MTSADNVGTLETHPEPAGYDAVLLVSFGGPEAPEEVMPFLERVTAGRGIPRARLEAVGHHYYALGGVSPINAQNRALRQALADELAARGVVIPLELGNRNSPPYITDVLAGFFGSGHRRILALATSAYSSYSGCRQYREDLGAAVAALSDPDLHVAKIRPFYDNQGFQDANTELLAEALAQVKPGGRSIVLFTTHSIPNAMAETCGPVAVRSPGGDIYSEQHRALAVRAVSAAAELAGLAESPPWQLVYQSRSGAPHVPWLEPDINDAIRELAGQGFDSLVVAPIGFISDHIEVIWDLDTEARETCDGLGVQLVRVPTAGVHPLFVAGLADLLLAHLRAGSDRSPGTPWEGYCGGDCCPAIRPGAPSKPTVPGVSA